MAIDENQKEEILFNYDELLLELSKIDDKNNTSTFFLSECKEKASWLAMISTERNVIYCLLS